MDNKNIALETFKSWLPLGVAIVVMSGLVYVGVQQNYRLSANDPQIQVAEDVADAVSQGTASLDSIVPANPTQDMAKSLSTFAAVYDDTGKALGASVQLDGKVPTPPAGVFAAAKKQGQNRFTWQPKPGVRVAAVLVKASGQQQGFVLVGRSLKEVEARENQLAVITAVATAAALALSYLVAFLLAKFLGTGLKTVVENIEVSNIEIDVNK